MFGFFLKKAVSFWLMPLQFSLLLALAGLALLWWSRRGQRTGRWLLTAAVLLLAVLSNKEAGLLLVRPLEARYAPVPELRPGDPLPAGLAECRYIVVLGSGQGDTPWLPATSKLSYSGIDRLTEAVRLSRLLPDAQLIMSGGRTGGGPSHARVLETAAISLGVTATRIERFDFTRDTADEARTIRRRLGGSPFALVTSAWHMPRAMALCRHLGLHPFPCPADFLAKPSPDFRWDDYEWDVTGLEHSTMAVHEWLGLLWTKLRGEG